MEKSNVLYAGFYKQCHQKRNVSLVFENTVERKAEPLMYCKLTKSVHYHNTEVYPLNLVHALSK